MFRVDWYCGIYKFIEYNQNRRQYNVGLLYIININNTNDCVNICNEKFEKKCYFEYKINIKGSCIDSKQKSLNRNWI